jgi:hypothetical protein
MSRVYLLVDVDGVLNRFAGSPESAEAEGYTPHTFAINPVQNVHTRLNLTHGKLLVDFAAEHDMELVWATMWNDEANTHLAPLLGIEPWPWIDINPWEARKRWKYPAIERYVEDAPIAWLDDDHGAFYTDELEFLARREKLGAPTLLVTVDPEKGLAQSHLDEVAAWRASL